MRRLPLLTSDVESVWIPDAWRLWTCAGVRYHRRGPFGHVFAASGDERYELAVDRAGAYVWIRRAGEAA